MTVYDDGEQWDGAVVVAGEQVTYRLHELRVEIDRLAGRDPDAWDDLTADEQALALAIGDVTVAWIVDHTVDDPAQLAEHLHNVRAWLARGLLPAWSELSADERQVAVDVMALVVAWLLSEGPR